MNFFNDLFLSVKSYGSAYRFVKQHKLWHFFFFPLLIGLLLLIGAFFGIQLLVEEFNSFNNSWLAIEGDADDWWNMGKTAFSWFANYVVKFGLIILYLTINKYIVLILVSPVLALLSEKVDQKLTGKEYPFNGDQFFRDVLRGVFMAIRNMCLEFGVIFLVLLLSMFLPFISPFTAMFLLIVEFYFYGFSLIDYTNERKRLKIGESVRYVRANKGLAVGNGGMFSLLFLIPLLGVVIAPVLGVVAATLAIHKKDNA
ncbi:MAG: CysZ protein [Flavobacteriales bacterium]|jgi:CysZ protein